MRYPSRSLGTSCWETVNPQFLWTSVPKSSGTGSAFFRGLLRKLGKRGSESSSLLASDVAALVSVLWLKLQFARARTTVARSRNRRIPSSGPCPAWREGKCGKARGMLNPRGRRPASAPLSHPAEAPRGSDGCPSPRSPVPACCPRKTWHAHTHTPPLPLPESHDDGGARAARLPSALQRTLPRGTGRPPDRRLSARPLLPRGPLGGGAAPTPAVKLSAGAEGLAASLSSLPSCGAVGGKLLPPRRGPPPADPRPGCTTAAAAAALPPRPGLWSSLPSPGTKVLRKRQMTATGNGM